VIFLGGIVVVHTPPHSRRRINYRHWSGRGSRLASLSAPVQWPSTKLLFRGCGLVTISPILSFAMHFAWGCHRTGIYIRRKS